MRPIRYSINVTLDGCFDHREMIADEELHRHAAENVGHSGSGRLERGTRAPGSGEGCSATIRSWTDVVRGAIEACRLKAREPAGVWFKGGGDEV